MGFIDTGIDFTHDDFKNPDGSTRIVALWDQTLGVSSNTPQPYGYGQHWDSVDINAGLTTATMTNGVMAPQLQVQVQEMDPQLENIKE